MRALRRFLPLAAALSAVFGFGPIQARPSTSGGAQTAISAGGQPPRAAANPLATSEAAPSVKTGKRVRFSFGGSHRGPGYRSMKRARQLAKRQNPFGGPF